MRRIEGGRGRLLAAALRGAAAALGAGAVLAATGCASLPSEFVGTWATTGQGYDASLTIEKDGTFSGTDGCNLVSGTAKASGDTLTFSDVSTTEIDCPGAVIWLDLTGSARLVDGGLEVTTEAGVVGTLPKAGPAS